MNGSYSVPIERRTRETENAAPTDKERARPEWLIRGGPSLLGSVPANMDQDLYMEKALHAERRAASARLFAFKRFRFINSKTLKNRQKSGLRERKKTIKSHLSSDEFVRLFL